MVGPVLGPTAQSHLGHIPIFPVSEQVRRIRAQARSEQVVVPRRNDGVSPCRRQFTRGESPPDFPPQSHNLVGLAEVSATHVFQHVSAEGQPVELCPLFGQEPVQGSLVVDRTCTPGRNLTKLTLCVFHVTFSCDPKVGHPWGK